MVDSNNGDDERSRRKGSALAAFAVRADALGRLPSSILGVSPENKSFFLVKQEGLLDFERQGDTSEIPMARCREAASYSLDFGQRPVFRAFVPKEIDAQQLIFGFKQQGIRLGSVKQGICVQFFKIEFPVEHSARMWSGGKRLCTEQLFNGGDSHDRESTHLPPGCSGLSQHKGNIK